MSAVPSTLTRAAPAYKRPPGLFARLPFTVQRGLARIRPPASARQAIDAVLSYTVGIDGDRLSVEGVALTVRGLAAADDAHETTIQRGLRWALNHAVLVRKPDPARRGGYLYAVAHPSRWSPVPCELAAVDAPGFGAVLVLPVYHPAPEEDPGAPADPMDNWGEGVHTERHTSHARSFVPTIRTDLSGIDRWYLWIGQGRNGYRVGVVEVVAEILDTRIPGWTTVLRPDPRSIPSAVVADLAEELAAIGGASWTWPAIRQAVARAVELADVIAADRAERARRAAKAAAVVAEEQAGRVLVEALALAAQVEPADPELAALLAEGHRRTAAGERGELAVYLAALDGAAVAVQQLAELRAERAAAEEARRVRAAVELDREALALALADARQLAADLAALPAGEAAPGSVWGALWLARGAAAELARAVEQGRRAMDGHGAPCVALGALVAVRGRAGEALQEAARHVAAVEELAAANVDPNNAASVACLSGDVPLFGVHLGGRRAEPGAERMGRKSGRVQAGSRRSFADKIPDGAVGQRRADVAPAVHAAPHRASVRTQAEHVAPGGYGLHRTRSGAAVRQTDQAPFPPLIGLAPPQMDDQAAPVRLEVLPAERGELGAAQAPSEAHQEQRAIPGGPGARPWWQAGDQVLHQERQGPPRGGLAQASGAAKKRANGWIGAGGAVPLRLVQGPDCGGLDAQGRRAELGGAGGEVEQDFGRGGGQRADPAVAAPGGPPSPGAPVGFPGVQGDPGFQEPAHLGGFGASGEHVDQGRRGG